MGGLHGLSHHPNEVVAQGVEIRLVRDDDYLSGLESAHHTYLDAGEAVRAVRYAFWLWVNLASRGEMARATGWFGRAQRLLEREGVTASSGATYCCPSSWSVWAPVTGRP